MEARDPKAIEPSLMTHLSRLAGGQEKWPFYLSGDVGTGKTCAALAMLDQYGPPWASVRTQPVMVDWLGGFIRVRDVYAMLRAEEGKYTWNRGPDHGEYGQPALEKFVRTAKLLVLDDFGAIAQPSDWLIDTVLGILDYRCGGNKRPLIVTSNLTPQEVYKSRWGSRIADRLLSGSRYHMVGRSRRTGL